MNTLTDNLWADPRLVYAVASAAVIFLLVTIWLFRRRKRSGRAAAFICLLLTLVLHAALIFLVPAWVRNGDSAQGPADDLPAGTTSVQVATFDPKMNLRPQSGTAVDAPRIIAPLPIATAMPARKVDRIPATANEQAFATAPKTPPSQTPSSLAPDKEAEHLTSRAPSPVIEKTSEAESGSVFAEMTMPGLRLGETAIDDLINDFETGEMKTAAPTRPATRGALDADSAERTQTATAAEDMVTATREPSELVPSEPRAESRQGDTDPGFELPERPRASKTRPPSTPSRDPGKTVRPSSRNTDAGPPQQGRPATEVEAATTPGEPSADFANRVGQSRTDALRAGGGDATTERAVDLALQFLARSQRADGGWSSAASGGGREQIVLGENRGGAGARADTAITGLALLAFTGAGNTHLRGQHADTVHRGLAFLIRKQSGNGSMAGDASTFAATYCHGMAALAMGEVAAITGDPSAVESARRAVLYTTTTQHRTTGGWRYHPGTPGDTSQLGWQAMVIDAGHRSGIDVPQQNVDGLARFLTSVRRGSAGGLASYQPGTPPSRTMTAEALATRLLLGHHVPQKEIDEAERYLMQQKPGTGKDNYYYWYYATLALHQLQDAAWDRWNRCLKDRLVGTQTESGNWPSETVWGAYGGTIYTTAMATLCLETYYRHQIRSQETRLAHRTRNTSGKAPRRR